MRDPFDELRTTMDQPTSLSPLPASEVRRRGDRMRRRRTTLGAIGAAAAIAVISSGSVLVGTSLTGTAAAPGPAGPGPTQVTSPAPTGPAAPDGGWLAAVPDRFDLADGMPEPDDGTARKVRDAPTAAWVLDPCHDGERRPEDGRSDLREAIQTGAGYYHRQLAVYPDAEAARQVVGELRDDLARCPSAPLGGVVEVWDRYGAPFAAGDESFDAVARALQEGEPTLFADHYAVVRVGNAVLVTLEGGSYGEEDPARIEQLVEGPRSRAAALAERMCVFAASPCGPGSAEGPSPAVQPSPAAEPQPVATPPAPQVTGDDLLTVDRLREVTGLADWNVVANRQDPTLDCQPSWLSGLGPAEQVFREFRAKDGGTVFAEAATAVLRFEDEEAARTAYATVSSWVGDCRSRMEDGRRLWRLTEPVTADNGYGPSTWRLVGTSAPEVCTECDAGWFDHQGVALVGDRVTLLSVNYLGDTQVGPEVFKAPLPRALDAAARLAGP